MLRPWSEWVPILAAILVGLSLDGGRVLASDPGNLLKARGLTASGWVYVLGSEAEFHSKVADARSLYQDWKTAQSKLIEQEQEAQEIQQLTANSNLLKQNIGQMQRQMSRVGYGGGRRGALYQRMQNQQIAAEVNLAQSNLNQMNQQLAQLKKNAPKPQDKKKVEDEASKRRESLHDAVAELVKTSDEIDRNYHELHQANEVETALTALNHSGTVKYKLGPSREHLADVKILQKLRHELALAGSPIQDAAKPKSKHPARPGSQSRKKSPSAVPSQDDP